MDKELVLTIGNTNVRYGLFNGNILIESGIYAEPVKKKMKKEKIVKALCISVNTRNLKKLKEDNKFIEIMEINKIKNKIKTEYDLNKLGIDRYMTIFKSQNDKEYPAILIDTGTADTFDFIDRKGIHIGGFITPGLSTMAKSLAKFTYALKEVEPEDGGLRVGKNTEEAIKYGIYMEWVTSIIAFVKLSENLISARRAIVCGGNALRLKDFLRNSIIDENYLLKAVHDYGKNI